MSTTPARSSLPAGLGPLQFRETRHHRPRLSAVSAIRGLVVSRARKNGKWVGTGILFRYRKPGPQGQVRDNRLCYKVLIEKGQPLSRLAGLARSPVSDSIAEA